MVHSWELQDSETGKQFKAFSDYLAMGGGRSLAALFREYQHQLDTKATPKPPIRTLRGLKQWSSDHNWVARAHEYDVYQADQDRLARDEARQKAQADIIEKEYEDYYHLLELWRERGNYLTPVDMVKKTEKGETITILKTNLHGFKTYVESRKKISEGLRLSADLPNAINRQELTGKVTMNMESLLKRIRDAKRDLDAD
jgi:hypothetical protein